MPVAARARAGRARDRQRQPWPFGSSRDLVLCGLRSRNSCVDSALRFVLTDGVARMTSARGSIGEAAHEVLPSTSGDLGLDLLGLRLNGAQLGAMLDVSRDRQSVV